MGDPKHAASGAMRAVLGHLVLLRGCHIEARKESAVTNFS